MERKKVNKTKVMALAICAVMLLVMSGIAGAANNTIDSAEDGMLDGTVTNKPSTEMMLSAGIASAFSNSGSGDWKYYRGITIKETSGKPLSDYQVTFGAQPDKLPIGTIYQGSIIEANFLIRNAKEIDSIDYPPWVIIRKTSENVEHSWGTSCNIYLSMDTSEIGDFSGVIEVDTDGGNVTVPISVSIRNSPPPLAKLLVTHTPFDRYSTYDGDDFNEMTRIFSENYINVDYLEYEVPSDLSDYDVILVAEDTLSGISDTEVNRLQDFIDRGEIVIVCADYFWGYTIAGANKIIEDYGLKMKYEEVSGEVIVKGDDIVPDNLTKGVNVLRFWRPSPVYKTGSAGKIVVKNPSDSSEGFVARSSNVGEVIVFGDSLWWWYLAESTEYDNSILFGNMVTYAIALPIAGKGIWITGRGQ